MLILKKYLRGLYYLINLIYFIKTKIQILNKKCLKEDHRLEEAHPKGESDNVNISTLPSSNINILRCWRE